MFSNTHKKTFFLTLDLEEWYHLEYLKKYSIDKKDRLIPDLNSFFEFLNNKNIQITVFILGELISENSKLIKEISKYHEISIHGWNHDLLFGKTKDIFTEEIRRTKNILEDLTGKEVVGYRAPCFSMSNEKLDWLQEIGIEYDSSFIQFSEHPLYGQLSMDEFVEIDDLIYMKNDFYEIEIPTLKILGRNIPISGGGYFRLFPRIFFKYLFNLYIKDKSNFNMYLHPFEISPKLMKINGISLKDKFRFSVGREKNIEKLVSFIDSSLKSNFSFKTIKSHIDYLKISKSNL